MANTEQSDNHLVVTLQSPVQRLRDTLLRAVSDQAVLAQGAPGAALAVLLRVQPEGERPNWSRAYVQLLELARDAKGYTQERVEAYENSPYAQTFSELEAILNGISLDSGWANNVQQLRQLATIALPFIAHATDGGRSALTVAAADLDGLRADLEQLLQRVLRAPFPEAFKVDFAEAVTRLRDVIVRFDIFGTTGVARASASLVGTLATNNEASKADPETIADAVDKVNKVQDLFIKAVSIGKISASVWRAITGGGAP